ncbi:MAG TPA: 2-oxoglutarate dehydrogenase, E2 component, dihydrolipoamide succinyltransferase [Thermoanaerobaculia bacterium]|nr:2-oxoglutarate dehydrogenase, E2 component, dihydrolipoamide succinyltransferase [Thermoanaerobaculia bacterium]
MIEVVMPEMGESVSEGTITRWLVAIGDAVEKDQPLVEISTDKVDAEIPSPAAGTIQEIRAEEGAVVQVDAVLAVIAADGAGARAPTNASTPAAAKVPVKEVAASSPPPEAAGAVSALAHPRLGRGGRLPAGDATPPAAGAVAETAVPAGERILATPIARKIAAAEGVDLASVRGSGAQGRVTREDVLRAIELRKTAAPSRPRAAAAGAAVRPAREPAAASPPAASLAASAAPAAPAGDFHVRPWVEGERVEIEPMSRIRKLTARHMSYSQATSVHVTTLFHIDMTRIVEIRERVKAAFEREHGTKLTFMPFVFRALATALHAHPKFNAAIDGETIVYKKDVNLGMAVALDWGLIVPVIHDADQASLAGLARKANDLAERARAKKLKPDEIQRGTFTVTNPGVFGSLFGTPIINQPQVAILCIGAIEKRPMVVADSTGRDAIAIRHMAYFALTYDHRLIDGADAELFMRDVKATLENETWSELTGAGPRAARSD